MSLPWNKIRLTAYGVVLAVLLTELVGHTYHRLRYGFWLWNDGGAAEIFRIRPFTVVVGDERVMTPIKNSRIPGLWTDHNGFRWRSSYERKQRNIVFLGDSVPFGWAVPATQSVPAHFAGLLERDGKSSIGTINAAVPSYSLRQAIARYECEVDGKYPVSAVVLQTWDPASQLALHGAAWTPEMNWTTHDLELGEFDRFLIRHLHRPMRYSMLLYHGFRARFPEDHALRLSPDDVVTRNRFSRHVIESLRELGKRLDKRHIALYLLPANPAQGLRTDDRQLTSVRWLNHAIQEYAKSAQRTHYIDIVERFDALGRDGLFVDDCCHLSDVGATRQAKIVYDEMSRNGDL